MIDKILEISKEAGEIVREGFGKRFAIEFKGTKSNIVTEIDKKSEAAIIEFIEKEFPGHAILAEESGEHKSDSEYTWVIDPIDGTTNFAHGLPIFSVSIGVTKGDEIVAGAIYDVMRDVMYSTEKGAGAFRNGEKINVNDRNDLKESLIVTGFPYNTDKESERNKRHFLSMLDECRGVRRLGSAAIDLCFVAEGIFDGFWESRLHPWDVCAGYLLIEEAGGRISNYANEDITIFSTETLASNGKIHAQMSELLNN